MAAQKFHRTGPSKFVPCTILDYDRGFGCRNTVWRIQLPSGATINTYQQPLTKAEAKKALQDSLALAQKRIKSEMRHISRIEKMLEEF